MLEWGEVGGRKVPQELVLLLKVDSCALSVLSTVLSGGQEGPPEASAAPQCALQ